MPLTTVGMLLPATPKKFSSVFNQLRELGMKAPILALVCAAFLTTGCATIINDDTVSLPITTNPSGANLLVNGSTYTSPATIQIPRGKGNFVLRIEKDGYQPVDVMLEQSLDGWVWGNIIFGGIIGVAVDFSTGQAYDVDPDIVNQDLQGATAVRSEDGAIQIVLVDLKQLPVKLSAEIVANSKRKV